MPFNLLEELKLLLLTKDMTKEGISLRCLPNVSKNNYSTKHLLPYHCMNKTPD